MSERARALLAALTLAVLPAAQAQDLVELVKAGDSAAVLQALSAHAAVNQRAADGSTALQWAVYQGDIGLVQRLIAAGADVRATNHYGATALHIAAANTGLEIIRALLAAGADADSPNADGETALMLVARTSRVDVAKLLLDHGAHVNAVEQWRGQTALMWAAAQGQPAMLRFLLAHHANPDARSAVNHWERLATAEPRQQPRPAGGLTPLLYAARNGCVDCVHELVRGKADINLADPDGITPLVIAILNAHFDTAAALLDEGANPNLWDKWGRAPLYSAVDYNTLPVGGRPDRLSLDKVTPAELAERLLKAGANPDMQLKIFPPFRDLRQDRAGDRMLTVGTTPLIRAAKAGDLAMVRLLLEHGADPNLPNSLGITPLHAAAGTGSTKLDNRARDRDEAAGLATAKLLVAAGAKVTSLDNQGRTALFGAAAWGWNDLIRYLVASGSRPDAKDAGGLTPVDAALGKGAGPVRFGITPDVHEDSAALLRELAKSGSPEQHASR
jgi:uncharacterized protein